MISQSDRTVDTARSARTCIICGTDTGGHVLYPGILRCPSCGLVFADAQLSHAELEHLYRREYFYGDEYLNYREDKPYLQRNFQVRLRTLRRFSSAGHLFEIGCAYGYFLELAARSWHAEGCDISSDACQDARSRGLNATAGDFLNLQLKENHYDVVALWDTIEHLSRPDLYVEKSARLLKTGGVLCVTTGDRDSFMARIRGPRWRLIHPPTHLYYFSKTTIAKLFSGFGLEIVHIQHVGYSRSVHQMLYSLLVLNRETKIRKNIYGALKPLFSFPLYLNLYDIMFVIARKK